MTYHARVDESGEAVLPAALTRQLGLAPGDVLMVDSEDGKLIVRTYQDIVREGQDRFCAMIQPGYTGSLVDELLADRRAEAERD